MKYSMLLSALFGAVALSACDKPTVVTTPAPAPAPASPSTVPVPVPVPTPVPGPTGPPGPQGETGQPGKPGGTTVIVTPPAASEPK
jgi:hypothetical protein